MAQSFQIDNLYLIKRQTRQNSFPQILKSKEQEFVEDVDEDVMVRDSAGEAWEEVKEIIRAEEKAKGLVLALPEAAKNLGTILAEGESKTAEDEFWGADASWGPGPWENEADEEWGTGPWEEDDPDDYAPMMEDKATQTDPSITQLDNPLVSAVRIFVFLYTLTHAFGGVLFSG